VDAATIPRLGFAVLGAERLAPAAVPTIAFAVQVRTLGGEAIRSVLLDVQVRIAPRRRAYDEAEEAALFDLFGGTAGWGSSLQAFPWTRATLVVPPFEDEAVVQLPVACSYDLDVAATRYFDALGGGDVPLELLFSGTVFYAGEDGRLQTVRIPWEDDVPFGLPVATWRAAIDGHFPGQAWLRLDRAAFDRLRAHRTRRALPSWEATLDDLLDGAS
jgi:Family of unknown function (DUF6084)